MPYSNAIDRERHIGTYKVFADRCLRLLSVSPGASASADFAPDRTVRARHLAPPTAGTAVPAWDEWAVAAALDLADGTEGSHGDDHEDEDEQDDGCHSCTHVLSPCRLEACGTADYRRGQDRPDGGASIDTN